MIPFTKAHGNGNDFMLFFSEKCPGNIREAEFIQRICHRRKGVGADGILIISPPEEAGTAYHVDYYNSDGSWETLCANGTRCTIQLWGRETGEKRPLKITTGAGIHETEILNDGRVRLQILPPRQAGLMEEVHGIRGQYVDSGAPHFAGEVRNLSHDLIAEKGPLIRHAERYAPRGVNVNLYERLDDHTINVMTYEKGVEEVVLSCASGSTAAAYHAAMAGPMTSPMTVHNPGGDLEVVFDAQWQAVSVIGPAVLVFDAQLPDDF